MGVFVSQYGSRHTATASHRDPVVQRIDVLSVLVGISNTSSKSASRLSLVLLVVHPALVVCTNEENNKGNE